VERLLVALYAFTVSLCAFAQVELPVFGKQEVINGYAKDVEGEVLSYFSVYPEHAFPTERNQAMSGSHLDRADLL
jgi:alpha-mannosidase